MVDLSDTWTPRVLAVPEGAVEGPSYRAAYVALSNEETPPDGALSQDDRYLELYGIFPTLHVLSARMLDEPLLACHERIDDSAWSEVQRVLSPWVPDGATQRERAARVHKWRVFLENARVRHGLSSVDALRSVEGYRGTLQRFEREDLVVRAIEAMQAHLRCDGLLGARVPAGVFDEATADALRVFQRAQFLLASGGTDAATRGALVNDRRELVFRSALRMLRERVSDALGLIEDGSAGGQASQVLGRDLDPPEMRAAAGAEPLTGAPDLISVATEAAARELGWQQPDTFAAFLKQQVVGADSSARRLVALRLPAAPDYHSAAMELRAELDRGDVNYAFPFRPDGTARALPVTRRPTLTLYARRKDGWFALVRWNTTIGGWQPEQRGLGEIGLRYKESPTGQRLWRDVVAAPAWFPPPTEPDRQLVRYDKKQARYVPKYDLFGPGYRSAYGLTMLVHLAATETAAQRGATSGEPLLEEGPEASFGSARLRDQGVRTHGSVAYGSILRGYSHGCHRLFNHLALRLSGFLLKHRQHVVRGALPALYVRKGTRNGQPFSVRLNTRGFLYELTPPVPIEVLKGRIVGSVSEPIRGLRPLPSELAERVERSAAGDTEPARAAGP